MTPTTEDLARELEAWADALDHELEGAREALLYDAAARLRELEGALVGVGELIIDLSDGLEDEGDRVFLQSTNDGDRLRQASFAAPRGSQVQSLSHPPSFQ